MQHKKDETFKAIENFINSYTDENVNSPSVRDIAAGVGISISTVSKYLNAMRDKGNIEFNGHRNITTRRMKSDLSGTNRTPLLARVPVVGSIACGLPKFAEENIEEYIKLPVSLFGRGSLFVLRASGDSMIDAGIDDGDYVVIRHQNYASEGQIVAALIEDETTLKRFYPEPEKQRIRLQPENKSMRPIYVQECIIQGIAVRVIKDLE